ACALPTFPFSGQLFPRVEEQFMSNSGSLLLLFLLLILPGCSSEVPGGAVSGEAPVSNEEADKPTSNAALKARLTEIAESGQGGSALSGVQSALDDLKASDAPLAESLTTDYAALSQESDPVKIKSIAKRMADKL
ncbi:MAG: hypothetical protein O3B86_14875, partial [Planctomycetota bacterium]|nr:hypothetical protein [Planctomycetota bacterium]